MRYNVVLIQTTKEKICAHAIACDCPTLIRYGKTIMSYGDSKESAERKAATLRVSWPRENVAAVPTDVKPNKQPGYMKPRLK